MSSGYYTKAAAAARQAVATSAVAAAREQALWKTSQDAAARLQIADAARQRGEIRVAARLYVRLARSRPSTDSSAAAKDRLKALSDDARQALAKIDAILTDCAQRPSLADVLADPDEQPTDLLTGPWSTAVRDAVARYERVVRDYDAVPGLRATLQSHINSQRRRPEIALVINEPEANTLLEAGRQHEAEDHQCCAYWVFRQAARLTPAPSARKAIQLLAALEQDPDILAKAEACRKLQQCHSLFARAEQVLTVNPDRARELFAQVTRQAPPDSELFRAAQQQLASVE